MGILKGERIYQERVILKSADLFLGRSDQNSSSWNSLTYTLPNSVYERQYHCRIKLSAIANGILLNS
jgi:hypothetical protein